MGELKPVLKESYIYITDIIMAESSSRDSEDDSEFNLSGGEVFVIGNETHTFFDEMCRLRKNTHSVLDHQKNFYGLALKFRQTQNN